MIFSNTLNTFSSGLSQSMPVQAHSLDSRYLKRLRHRSNSEKTISVADLALNRVSEKKISLEPAEKKYPGRDIKPRRSMDREQLSLIEHMIKRKASEDNIGSECTDHNYSNNLMACLTKQVGEKNNNAPVNLKWRKIEKKEIHPVIKQIQILDLPGLDNDFYKNILDLSKKNVVAIALGGKIYFKNLKNSNVTSLDSPNATSVHWLDQGKRLVVGTRQGLLEIWNTAREDNYELEYSIQLHPTRIGTITHIDKQLVIVGNHVGSIYLIKLDKAGGELLGEMRGSGRVQEICSLSLSCDSKYLASGTNCNRVFIWNTPISLDSKPLYIFHHNAAIKAMAWNPLKAMLLATGGGQNDQTIKFWNVNTGKELCRVHTGESISGLYWLADGKYLVSTHGQVNLPGRLRLWCSSKIDGKYMLKEIPILPKESDGFHDNRIIYSALSFDRKSLLTVGGDNLIVWDIKALSPEEDKSSNDPFNMFGSTIR